MKRYTVMTLDVWGHAAEECPEPEKCRAREMCGYEINNWFKVGTVEIDDHATNGEILRLLGFDGYINPNDSYVAPWYAEGLIEVNAIKHDRPLLQLQEVEE